MKAVFETVAGEFDVLAETYMAGVGACHGQELKDLHADYIADLEEVCRKHGWTAEELVTAIEDRYDNYLGELTCK